jgi:quercetin dioxygenase-like cupin family protein
LPTPEAPLRRAPGSRELPAYQLVRSAAAQSLARPGGQVQLLLDPVATRVPAVSAALLTFAAGTAVPRHQHTAETELLYILEGAGTLTLGELSLPVTPTSVLSIPRGVPHAFVASAPLRAIQLYTPGGPEQRFKAPPPPGP